MQLLGTAHYWMMRRYLFFLEQRVFAICSFLLLDNAASGRLRVKLLCALGAKAGRNVNVRGGLIVLEWFNFTFGDNVYVGSQCTLDGAAEIVIGNEVNLAYGVMIITGTHHIGPTQRRAGQTSPHPVKIGDGCWVGARATILPGVTIGNGAVIGAASVVTRDVPPDTVVTGNPARVVRTLIPEGHRQSEEE